MTARKAFEAYFISSAVSRCVTSTGVSIRYNGRYNVRITSIALSVSAPTTTLSGRMKSVMAEPSRKNSGFEATSNAAAGFVSAIIF